MLQLRVHRKRACMLFSDAPRRHDRSDMSPPFIPPWWCILPPPVRVLRGLYWQGKVLEYGHGTSSMGTLQFHSGTAGNFRLS